MPEIKEKLPFAFNETESEASREQSFTPDYTYPELLSAAYDLAEESTPVISLARLSSIREMNQNFKDRIEPKELNELYPNLPVPFAEAQSLPVADLIASRQLKRVELQQRIAAGPDSMFYGISTFAAGIVPHMLDPLNIAGGLLVSAGAGVALAGTRVGTALGIGAAAPTAGQIFLRGAAEGVVENVLIQEPLAATAAASDLEQYGVEDFFVNSVGSAIGFSAARYGLVKGVSGVRLGINKGAEFMGRFSGKQAEAMERSAIAQLMSDRRVNIEPLIEDVMNDTMGEAPDGIPFRRPHGFVKLQSDQMGGKVFYASSERSVKSLQEAGVVPMHEDFGNGVNIVDHPGIANGAAARKLSDVEGAIFELKLASDIKMLDLNEVSSPAVLSALKDAFPNVEKVVGVEGKPLKQVLSEVQDFMAIGKYGDNALERFNALVKNMGFDGYHHDGGEFLGVKHDNANHALVFDPRKLEQQAVYKPDASKVPRMDDVRVRELADTTHAVENNINWDANAMARVKEVEARPEVDKKAADLAAEVEDLSKMVDDLERQGLLDSADKADLDDIKALTKDESLLEKIIDGATSCMGRQR